MAFDESQDCSNLESYNRTAEITSVLANFLHHPPLLVRIIAIPPYKHMNSLHISLPLLCQLAKADLVLQFSVSPRLQLLVLEVDVAGHLAEIS